MNSELQKLIENDSILVTDWLLDNNQIKSSEQWNNFIKGKDFNAYWFVEPEIKEYVRETLLKRFLPITEKITYIKISVDETTGNIKLDREEYLDIDVYFNINVSSNKIDITEVIVSIFDQRNFECDIETGDSNYILDIFNPALKKYFEICNQMQ